ncbi:hypothetical protein EJB05_41556 [Eragrostis curvula]|uniref:Rit1 N-terminal domain-containing protein n=1 Tax=Eragrostis curvula TaxID=38414 RepID=A0A5J9T9U1_9POAL|nr:hypothetical protein EJB05_41556 [Eragrostis curvula]
MLGGAAHQAAGGESTLYNALRRTRPSWPRSPTSAPACGMRRPATCYFKSAGGHGDSWAFSTARLNLHLALLAGRISSFFIFKASDNHNFASVVIVWETLEYEVPVGEGSKTINHHQVTRRYIRVPSSDVGGGVGRRRRRVVAHLLLLLTVLVDVFGDLLEPVLDGVHPGPEVVADDDLRGECGGQLEPAAPGGAAGGEAVQVGLAQELVEHVLHVVRDVPRLPHPQLDVVVGALAPLLVGVLDERLQPLQLVAEQQDVLVHAAEQRRLLHRLVGQAVQHERDGSRCHGRCR